MQGSVEFLSTIKEIAEAGASEFARAAASAIAERGRFVVALSARPGSVAVCRRLAEPPYPDEVDWARVWVFATDQRVGPTGAGARPLAPVREALLDRVRVAPEHVFVDESAQAEDVAARTAAALAEVTGGLGADLVLLEMGEHGRIASVFSGTATLYDSRRGAVAVWVPDVGEWRVTLTLPEINAARLVIVVTAGADRAAAVRDLHSGASGVPAARLKPAGELVWLVDQAAGDGLSAVASTPAARVAISTEPTSPADTLKRAAAEAALSEVTSGMRLGLGTGSTVRWVIEGLAREIARGRLIDITAVPTSAATAQLANSLHIPLRTLEVTPELDLVIDGADEIDPSLNLVKGGGGALLREKIVAGAARRFVVVADESKLVDRLLLMFPLPVEVDPFGWTVHRAAIAALGGVAQIRRLDGEPLRTDGGHYVLDCRFDEPVADLHALHAALRARPGVIETGLFLGMAQKAYVASSTGVIVREPA
jgi:ribose 5-phosphate isomerase A